MQLPDPPQGWATARAGGYRPKIAASIVIIKADLSVFIKPPHFHPLFSERAGLRAAVSPAAPAESRLRQVARGAYQLQLRFPPFGFIIRPLFIWFPL